MVYYSHSTHKRNLEDNLYSLGIYKAFNIVKQKMYWRIILMCSECMWTYNERIWICEEVVPLLGLYLPSPVLSRLLYQQAVVTGV